MRSYAPVSLALLLVLLTACQAHAAATSLLTVTCEAPQGVDMSYGGGLLGLQQDRVATASVAYPDLQPTFVVEDDKPQRLLVTFRAQSARQGPPEPEPALEAAILYSTDDQITAVAPRGEAVWMYSLFPKLGMGYFVTHNHIPFGSTSRSVATYARCRFVQREP
jgi:hypothetical protein